MRYASNGKEVLCDHQHFADCTNERDATRTAAILNIADDATRGALGVSRAIELCRSMAALGHHDG